MSARLHPTDIPEFRLFLNEANRVMAARKSVPSTPVSVLSVLSSIFFLPSQSERSLKSSAAYVAVISSKRSAKRRRYSHVQRPDRSPPSAFPYVV